MESRPPIQYNFDKGETEEEENEKQQQKDYIIKAKDIIYKLIIKNDSENIEFKINIFDKLNLSYYYNKYSLEKMIDYLKLDISSYNNLSKIMKLIDDSYSNNKIQIDIDNYNNSKLIIILDNTISKNYKSTFNMIKKDLGIKEKFEIIINELKEMKKTNTKLIKNKFNDIEKILFDLKESTSKTIKENIESINSLKYKIKENEDLLEKNKNTILSLKKELDAIKSIFEDYNMVKKPQKNKTKKKGDISKNDNQIKNDLIKKEKDKNINTKIVLNNKINEKEKEKGKEQKKNEGKKLSELKVNNDKEKENQRSQKKYKFEKLFEDEDEKSTLSFKVMMIGDNQVGKSWIFDSLFSISLTKSPSIGLESDNIYIKLNEELLTLNITDSPGSEAIYKMNLSLASKQDFIIFVYAIDNIKSFETIASRIKEIKKICKESTHYILIGNKKDLIKERVVPTEKGQDFAKNENLDLFMEISAKTEENVDMVFYEITKILYVSRK